MSRLLLLALLAASLAGCDSYYGGAPGYAVNGRQPLSQLPGYPAIQEAAAAP
ncbi:MAG TPA: hypothetical protein VNF99_19985 [Stellaceae bacterium]|nr:hypothetical protein [Stellaceae bacterium]